MIIATLVLKALGVALEATAVVERVIKLKGIARIAEIGWQRWRRYQLMTFNAEELAKGIKHHVVCINLAVG